MIQSVVFLLCFCLVLSHTTALETKQNLRSSVRSLISTRHSTQVQNSKSKYGEGNVVIYNEMGIPVTITSAYVQVGYLTFPNGQKVEATKDQFNANQIMRKTHKTSKQAPYDAWAYDPKSPAHGVPLNDVTIAPGQTMTVKYNDGEDYIPFFQLVPTQMYFNIIPSGQIGPLTEKDTLNYGLDHTYIGKTLTGEDYMKITQLNEMVAAVCTGDCYEQEAVKVWFNTGKVNPKYAAKNTLICTRGNGGPAIGYYSDSDAHCRSDESQPNMWPCPGKLNYNHCPQIQPEIQPYTFSQDGSGGSNYKYTVKLKGGVGASPIFGNFEGRWVYRGQQTKTSTVSLTESVTFTEADTATATTAWQNGVTISAKQGAGVLFAQAELSETVSSSVTMTSTDTITKTRSGTQSITCSTRCSEGLVWQWQTQAVLLKPNSGQPSIVSECTFACRPSQKFTKDDYPVCPGGYCGDEVCSCCTGPWRADTDDATANNLCKKK